MSLTRVATALIAAAVLGLLLAACSDAPEQAPAAPVAPAPAPAPAVAPAPPAPAPVAEAASAGPASTPPSPASGAAGRDAAPVTEAELGVPIYPGVNVDAAMTQRVDGPDGSIVMTRLQSLDPAPQVTGFYRDLLTSRAAGQPFAQSETAEGTTLLLGDDQGRSSLQVVVTAVGSGADISITRIRAKADSRP